MEYTIVRIRELNFTKTYKQHVEAFEMWCWWRMMKISRKYKLDNEEVLKGMNKNEEFGMPQTGELGSG